MAEDKKSIEQENKTRMQKEQGKSKTAIKERGPSKKNLLLGIAGVILAVVIILIAVLVFRKAPNPKDPKASPTYSRAFFIYNDGKYTLWNSDGKKLIDDEFDDKSAFIGGYAYIRKGSEYAFINDSGKIILNFGQISSIEDYGAGLYLIKDNNSAQHLMLGNGKVLVSGDDIDLDFPSSTATFASAEFDGKYNIYNYAGVLMAQIESVKDTTMRFSSSDDFGLVYYNGWNLLFDTRSGKQITMFEGERFSIDTVSDDRSVILLNEYENSTQYKVVRDGILFDLNETKSYGMIRNTNIIVGYDDYDSVSLLDNNYKVIKEVNSYLALKDPENYATINSEGKVEILYRGKVVKTFDQDDVDLVSGVLANADLYAIKSDGKYRFYHMDGSFAFGEYSDVYSLFDTHRHTSVSDDGERYYMIDANGNRVNDLSYQRAYTYENSYVIYNDNSKRAILTATGVPITDFEYVEAYNRNVAVDHEIWSLKRDSNIYDVVDATATENKLIVSNVNAYDFYAHYFTTKNDEGGYDYYTYKGVLFFRTTKN